MAKATLTFGMDLSEFKDAKTNIKRINYNLVFYVG